MKITKLIKVLEKTLPLYQEALYWSREQILSSKLCNGICHTIFTMDLVSYREKSEFFEYYEDYFTFRDFYLCPKPLHIAGDAKRYINKYALIPRIEFMQSQIIELKSLLKQGYTDI